MATKPIYAVGGRRSAAPMLTLPTSPQTQVVNQLVQLMQSQQTAPAPVATPAKPAAPAKKADPTNYGNAGNFSGQSSSAGTTDPQGFRRALTALQAGAMLSGDASAARGLGQVGTLANVATAKNPMQVAAALAPTVASKLGIPGSVVGLGMAAVNKDAAAAYNAALGFISPQLALVNQLFGAITGTTIGSMIAGTSAESTTPAPAPAMPAAGEFSEGDSSSLGPNDAGYYGGFSGIRGSSNGGFGGGYGGGIGQSGGNASGMGSSQA